MDVTHPLAVDVSTIATWTIWGLVAVALWAWSSRF